MKTRRNVSSYSVADEGAESFRPGLSEPLDDKSRRNLALANGLGDQASFGHRE